MPDLSAVVFVVDDDVSVRESLELLIRTAGWQPQTFASAHEFLSHPRPSGPCCLVLDVTLPGLNGLELQMQLELGEIDDEEFVEIERAVLARMREIRESREERALGLPPDARVVGVDVTFEAPDEPEDR